MDAISPAPSPFLPNTNIQYAWDSTSIGYFKTCPRLYQYIMVEGWGSGDESVHLRFGQEIHTAFQDYEKLRAAGESRTDAIRTVVQEAYERTWDWRPEAKNPGMEKAIKYKNRESLIRTIVWYFEHYHQDNATTYMLDNGRPAVELSFQYELESGPADDQPFILCGHLDRVVNFQGELYVMDYKTTTQTVGPYFFDQFDPNNQMTLYTLAGKVILDTAIRGVIIEGIQMMVDSNRFVRGMTFRTPDRLEEWLRDLDHFFAQAELYGQNNYWPQNDTACDKFGGCRFRKICSLSPDARPRFLESNYTKLADADRWNPLRPR